MEDNTVTSENESYLTDQIITYLGNKRTLLKGIGNAALEVSKKLGKEKLITFDGFSGSGIVARYLKQFSSTVYANDLEHYSYVINSCYLANPSLKTKKEVTKIIRDLNTRASKLTDSKHGDGIIRSLYSPKDANTIKKGERTFYTPENARKLDFLAQEVQSLEPELRPFIYGPLLYAASVNVNTSGIFKGFHKNKAGYGQYGGENQVALSRILKPIILQEPVFSNFYTDFEVYQDDTTSVAQRLHSQEEIDFTYLDPPYNQHPYGSNYFMLNLLLEYKMPEKISKVSGIVEGWNRSAYNKKAEVLNALEGLVGSLNSKFIAIAYNNEGFVSHNDFLSSLAKHGTVKVEETKYPAFRGSRNLGSRETYVTELIYLLEKS